MPIIKAMVRNNICINSHPAGCVKIVEDEIEYTKKYFATEKIVGAPKLALVIGCSTGYGLASRIALEFGCNTVTVGISFEKEGSGTKPGTPGFYNNLAFERSCEKAGLAAKTLNGDAYSHDMKNKVIDSVKKIAQEAGIPAKIDLIVYSLASPVRTDPEVGVMYKSVIKPIGSIYSGSTIDIMSAQINQTSVEPATEEEIINTIKVMGGEDWEIWMNVLGKADVLADDVRSVAYTYIGPELSWAIYKNGTIGQAKQDLERAAKAINQKFGRTVAFISVNKAAVTRASAVIPIIPFYISCLFRVMKDMKIHEGCIEQMCRLYKDHVYRAEAAQDSTKIPVDEKGLIRLDDWEMRDDVQKATIDRMGKITQENIFTESDVQGFKHDFLAVHGFDVEGVDYESDVVTDTI
ncbi:MAG: trans-2-enoyl-CoA reductase family protein [Spirochaetaceae bacterium]|jgi:enoyl-[acyl-carrier protein] reductase/trans-2-enoyl-CoA reductase (NAD+)|nr:trans-2-enoyl-CoA reductase family protein [Spirochaetaceae bacterium]